MNLKAKVSVVAILMAGIAIVGSTTTPGASPTRSPPTPSGLLLPLFCTCYFSASSDEHKCGPTTSTSSVGKPLRQRGPLRCDRVGQPGSRGRVAPQAGPRNAYRWAVVTFDKEDDAGAARRVGKVLAIVFPVKWKRFSTREDAITFEQTARALMPRGERSLRDFPRQDRTNRLTRTDRSSSDLQYWGSTSNEDSCWPCQAPLQRRRREPEVLPTSATAYVAWTRGRDSVGDSRRSELRRRGPREAGGQPPPLRCASYVVIRDHPAGARAKFAPDDLCSTSARGPEAPCPRQRFSSRRGKRRRRATAHRRGRFDIGEKDRAAAGIDHE